MSTLDHYTTEQLRKGLSDLMYFLSNPRLDPVIWRVHEDSTDDRHDHSKPQEDSTSDLS